MSRVSLPPDLVRSVAEYLQDDRKTLVSLCFLDKESFNLVIPLLYKSIRLHTIKSIQQFCNTILQSERNLGIYPTSIQFSPEDPSDEQLCHLIDPVQNILCQSPNLTDLVLEIDITSLPKLYQRLRSNPPSFSLHQLTCFFVPDYLLYFLSTQPFIHSLTIHESHLPLLSYYIRTAPPSSFLPRLQRITANALTIHALLPGRPVSYVDTGSAILTSGTARIFCESLRGSSAPGGVESVSVCVSQTRFWTDASDFMIRLAKVCGSCLQFLRLRMPQLPVGNEMVSEYWCLVL